MGVIFSFSLSLCRFYLYKLPRQHHEPVEDGLKYLFMDGESEGWTDGNTLVNDSQSAVGQTVGPLYEVQITLQLCIYDSTTRLKKMKCPVLL